MIAATENSLSEDRWTVPVRVDVDLSVLDCSSRLPTTIRARCYDKVRHVLNTVPQRIRAHFADQGLAVPEVHLRIHGLNSILVGFSEPEILAACESVESAGLDARFDRIRLLQLDVSGGARSGPEITIIPELLKTCRSSELILQLASSIKGGNARDFYATALVLLLDEVKPEVGSRIILSCNDSDGDYSSAYSISEIAVSATFSVWPLMNELRKELTLDACYSDRAILLGFIGEKVSSLGTRQQATLCENLRAAGVRVRETLRTNLSVNASGEGPGPAATWAGFPISTRAGASSNHAAAVFLKHGLTSSLGANQCGIVESDGLPLTSSIRNIFSVSDQLTPANLAGYLVRLFSDAVDNQLTTFIRIISCPDVSSSLGSSIEYFPGTIPLADDNGWLVSHFVNGGLILQPPGIHS